MPVRSPATRRALDVAAAATVAVLTACGAPPSPGASPPSPTAAPPDHAGHHAGRSDDHLEGAHAPLVHRFQTAEQWAREFDNPERDAWQKPQEVVAAMKIESGMTVADLGAGTGYFESLLSRAVGPTGSVLALDVESDMVRYLGERMQREHLENVRPGLVATDDPKLGAGTVDRILVVDVWHHIDAREAYAGKLRDALKSGGKVFVVDFKLDATRGPPKHHRLAPEQIAHELGAAGLAVETLATSLPEQYIVVGTRR
jgi:predicted methyltransferase